MNRGSQHAFNASQDVKAKDKAIYAYGTRDFDRREKRILAFDGVFVELSELFVAGLATGLVFLFFWFGQQRKQKSDAVDLRSPAPDA
jgi:hypothetical protein